MRRKENWKDVPGYDGKYEMEEFTKRVRNKRTNTLLNPCYTSREHLFSMYDILGEKKTWNLNTVWKMTFGGDKDASED